MNEKKLKHAVEAITMPEESKQKLIQKLDMFVEEDHVFQAKPTKLPVFQYVLTGVVACAVLMISAGGILHITGIKSNSQLSPSSYIDISVFDISDENQIYAITQESGTQYFNLSASDTAILSENLQTVLTNHSEDFQTNFMVGGRKEFIICSESKWFEFWNDNDNYFILAENLDNPEEQTYCISVSPEEYESIKIMLANPETYFDLPYENQNSIFYGHLEQEILDDIFQEKISPFGDVAYMEKRLIFTEYAPLYLLPTEEQHHKLADLLSHAEFEDITEIDTGLLNLYEGQFFTIYFDAPEERFTVRFQLSGYIIFENTQEVYKNPELVSEIYDLFIPADTLYTLKPTDALYELNQEQIFEQMFDNKPIEFQQENHPDSVTIQIENKSVLIHDKSFSRDAQGNYQLEYDTQYLISEEQKQQLSELIASQELRAVIGYPEFQKEDNYQKFVIEFTEQDGFLTVEYDSKNKQYYLILCSQMKKGECCYFPVTEEFYQNWNALLVNPDSE